MANWTGFSMTSRGAELQAKVNAGSTTLTFTKLALGSGEAEGSLENLTELVHKEMDMTIKSISNEGNIVTLRSTITNKGISQAFYAREMGLYATDPDLGEILYAIQTDPKPDNIPAEGSATVVSEDFTAYLIMSNTGSVSAVLDTGALLTLEDLRNHEADETAHEAAFDKHNKEENAHSGILQKISTLGDDIIKKLALTTTIAAISALQTNSWFGQLLKMVLTASGVKYNIEQNGYICLGSFFGGLIIQWGKCENSNASHKSIYYPLTVSTPLAIALSSDQMSDQKKTEVAGYTYVGPAYFNWYPASASENMVMNARGMWILLAK